jgi:hypothetical protein
MKRARDIYTVSYERSEVNCSFRSSELAVIMSTPSLQNELQSRCENIPHSTEESQPTNTDDTSTGYLHLGEQCSSAISGLADIGDGTTLADKNEE